MKQPTQIFFALVAAVLFIAGAAAVNHDLDNVTISASHMGNNTYELTCQDMIDADRYNWDFGDGNQTLDAFFESTQHTFAPGNHTVECMALNSAQNMSSTGNLTITVATLQEPTNITPTPVDEEMPMSANESDESTNQTTQVNRTPVVQIISTNDTNITDNETENRTDTGFIDTITDVFTTNDTSVSLEVERLGPGEYRFTCEADGYSPESYDWNFGDQNTMYDTQQSTIVHQYSMPGTKVVFCGSWAQGVYEHDRTTIEVLDIEPQARVEVTPHGNATYTFRCEVDAWTADTYDWDFGDGTVHFDTSNQTVDHTFNRSGTYAVSCGPWNQQAQQHVTGYTHINVTGVSDEIEQDIRIVREYLGDDRYRFTCETPGMTPMAYDWEVYDVYGTAFEVRDHDVENDWIEHTFDTDGKHVISCTATDEQQTIIDWQFLTIAGTNTDHGIAQETAEQQRPRHVTQVRITDDRATLLVTPQTRGDIWVAVETDVARLIEFSELVDNGQVTTPAAITFESNVQQGELVRIPANTTIIGQNWDGLFWLPHKGALQTAQLGNVTGVVRIGSDTALTLDRAVRVVFAGRAGQQVAIEHGTELMHVTQTCAQDTQVYADSLAQACAVSVDGDLVLWTKSFSQFVTYEDEEETPELATTQEERQQQQAVAAREQNTMQSFDEPATPPTEPTTTPTTGLPTDTPIELDEPRNWLWIIVALAGLGIGAAILVNVLRRPEDRYGRR